MTNLEWLNENLTKEEKSNVQMCVVVNKKFYKYTCAGKNCYDCPLNKVGDLIDFLLLERKEQEHREPIKLTKFEYDLLMSYINKGYYFKNYSELKEMRYKGYFKGITDTSMKIQYILKNCEVIE